MRNVERTSLRKKIEYINKKIEKRKNCSLMKALSKSNRSTKYKATKKVKRQKQDDHVCLQQKLKGYHKSYVQEVKNNDKNINVDEEGKYGSDFRMLELSQTST